MANIEDITVTFITSGSTTFPVHPGYNILQTFPTPELEPCCSEIKLVQERKVNSMMRHVFEVTVVQKVSGIILRDEKIVGDDKDDVKMDVLASLFREMPDLVPSSIHVIMTHLGSYEVEYVLPERP